MNFERAKENKYSLNCKFGLLKLSKFTQLSFEVQWVEVVMK